MKLNVLVIALAAAAFGSLGANAQTVIEERHDPAVVIHHPDASVTVHEHSGAVGSAEKKTVTHETNGLGCSSKTVHKEDVTGSKTVKRKNCD